MTKQRKGFTLVELSIVLIIIGLIIGGVLKGTDLINSAKQKKFYNTFVKTWQLTANQYQDRTGQILGDGTVNGGTLATTDGLRDAPISLANADAAVVKLLSIGLDIPVTNTGAANTYSVEGKYITSIVTATLNQQSVNGSARNVFYMTNVPTDAAMAIDTMIDGVADADSGDARISAAANTALVDGATVLTWGDAAATATNKVNMTILF